MFHHQAHEDNTGAGCSGWCTVPKQSLSIRQALVPKRCFCRLLQRWAVRQGRGRHEASLPASISFFNRSLSICSDRMYLEVLPLFYWSSQFRSRCNTAFSLDLRWWKSVVWRAEHRATIGWTATRGRLKSHRKWVSLSAYNLCLVKPKKAYINKRNYSWL